MHYTKSPYLFIIALLFFINGCNGCCLREASDSVKSNFIAIKQKSNYSIIYANRIKKTFKGKEDKTDGYRFLRSCYDSAYALNQTWADAIISSYQMNSDLTKSNEFKENATDAGKSHYYFTLAAKILLKEPYDVNKENKGIIADIKKRIKDDKAQPKKSIQEKLTKLKAKQMIKAVNFGLASDIIGCLVDNGIKIWEAYKKCQNAEVVRVTNILKAELYWKLWDDI